MTAQYRRTLTNQAVIRNADEAVIFLSDAKNTDTIAYLAWLAGGGVPDPFVPLPPPPAEVLAQDLMAQFTAADAAAIQAAIAGNVNFWLLWQAMTAQKDPMIVTNPRFKAGWAALVQVLGQPRMTAIATALNVTIV